MRTNVFKRTSDDWCPSYTLEGREGNLVEVSFIKLRAHYGDTPWRVCVWGADDMGLERDYKTESEAWVVFLQVIGWEDVTQERLIKELGFYGA